MFISPHHEKTESTDSEEISQFMVMGPECTGEKKLNPRIVIKRGMDYW